MTDDDERLAHHPLVRQMIAEGTRDKPLTLNWAPLERDAYDHLRLPNLTSLATKARRQIIAEALAAGDRYVSYSRRAAFYNETQRYYRETYTFRAVVPAIDQLAREGLLEHEKMPQGHRGFQSRFRATPDLIKELRATDLQYRPLELIIIRDEAGRPIDYRDNRETRRMRKRLTELNEGLAAQQIGLGDQVVREGDQLSTGRAQLQMHRVFHRGDLAKGGRSYGPYWQNMPKANGRDRLTINGQPTVEVDYRGLHIRLLYQEAGKQMPADPYDIDGWPREQVKLAILIAINARSHISAVRALADALRGKGGISDPFATADKLVKEVKARHPDIAWAFGSDAGVRLMRRDSDMAERIMMETVRAIGIVPLAVHDSFIVPIQHKELLMQAMEDAISCGNNSPKVSCGNSPQFGDNIYPTIPITSPILAPQYGMEEKGLGVEASGMCGLAAQRQRLQGLVLRLERCRSRGDFIFLTPEGACG